MSSALAFAHYLILETKDATQSFYFQNYWVSEDASYGGATYGFLPFVFSGITVTKAGDNQPATLGFPNNELTRAWATNSVENEFIVKVRTMLIDADNKSNPTSLNEYVAQVISGKWDSTALTLELASVFDAVGGDVPRKRLTEDLVGHLPLTSSVRVA